jgi:hypothetical protein
MQRLHDMYTLLNEGRGVRSKGGHGVENEPAGEYKRTIIGE